MRRVSFPILWLGFQNSWMFGTVSYLSDAYSMAGIAGCIGVAAVRSNLNLWEPDLGSVQGSAIMVDRTHGPVLGSEDLRNLITVQNRTCNILVEFWRKRGKPARKMIPIQPQIRVLS